MKTLQRSIYFELLKAFIFVALALLSLLYFFDLIEEISDVGEKAESMYTLGKAILYTTLQLPGHLYLISPIAALIACIFVMTRFAQTQEFTVMRTSGFTPTQALRMTVGFGFGLALFCFVLGDYAVPAVRAVAEAIKSPTQGSVPQGFDSRIWVKALQDDGSVIVYVDRYDRTQAKVYGLRVYQFDSWGRLGGVLEAQAGQFEEVSMWILRDVRQTGIAYSNTENGPKSAEFSRPIDVKRERLESYRWRSPVSRVLLESTALKPERMTAWGLYQHAQSLQVSGQNAQLYEIEFWRKVFYPISCMVMVVLALPFAYLHFRGGGVAGFVFVGVLIGVSFFLLNSMFGYLGYLREWPPWLAAGAPSLMYSVFSLAAFIWLVLRH